MADLSKYGTVANDETDLSKYGAVSGGYQVGASESRIGHHLETHPIKVVPSLVDLAVSPVKGLYDLAVKPLITGELPNSLRDWATTDRGDAASYPPGEMGSNPLSDAYGNAIAAVGAAKGTPAPELSPEFAPKPAQAGGTISGLRTAWNLYKQVRKLSPTKLGEGAFEKFLDFAEGKAPEPPAAPSAPAAPPAGPVDPILEHIARAKANVEAQAASAPKPPRGPEHYGHSAAPTPASPVGAVPAPPTQAAPTPEPMTGAQRAAIQRLQKQGMRYDAAARQVMGTPIEATQTAPPAGADYVMPEPAAIPANATPAELAQFSPRLVMDWLQQRARPAIAETPAGNPVQTPETPASMPKTPAEAVKRPTRGKVVTIPSPEPEFPQSTYEAIARAEKTTKAAQFLHDKGLTYETVKHAIDETTPEQAKVFVQQIADNAGVKGLSMDHSVPEMLLKLKKLGQRAKMESLNPRAAQAAIDLEKEMNR